MKNLIKTLAIVLTMATIFIGCGDSGKSITSNLTSETDTQQQTTGDAGTTDDATSGSGDSTTTDTTSNLTDVNDTNTSTEEDTTSSSVTEDGDHPLPF